MADGKHWILEDDLELADIYQPLEESHNSIEIAIPSSSNQVQSQEFPIYNHVNQPLTFNNPNQTLTDPNLGYGYPQTLTDPNSAYAYPQTPIDPNSAYAYIQTPADPNLTYGNPFDNPPPNLELPWAVGREGTDECAASPPGKGKIRLRYRCGVHAKKAQPYAEWKVSFCPCDFKRFRFTFDKP